MRTGIISKMCVNIKKGGDALCYNDDDPDSSVYTPLGYLLSFFFLGFSQLLFSQLIHSPGSQRWGDRDSDPARSFFYAREKESETESGNRSSV